MKQALVKSNKWKRRVVRSGLLLIGVLLFYKLLLLPRLLRWGATADEYRRALPGDELVPHKDYKNTLAVTVSATPSQIWPWVAQMGLHKGGFYSYTWLENLFGCKLVNADRLHPEWQQPKAGDIEPVCASQEGKPHAGWQIAIVTEEKNLVWQGRDSAQWMMGLYIDSINAHTSRLLTRQQFRYPKTGSLDWVLEKLWFEWAHCLMQRGMLNGIRKRAQLPATGSANPAAAIYLKIPG